MTETNSNRWLKTPDTGPVHTINPILRPGVCPDYRSIAPIRPFARDLESHVVETLSSYSNLVFVVDW